MIARSASGTVVAAASRMSAALRSAINAAGLAVVVTVAVMVMLAVAVAWWVT